MFKVHLVHEDYANILNIYVIQDDPTGKHLVSSLDPLEFDPDWKPGMAVNKPTITLGGSLAQEFLQGFVDAAAKLNITPAGKPVLENELSATKYHLEDMRTLVKHYHVKHYHESELSPFPPDINPDYEGLIK